MNKSIDIYSRSTFEKNSIQSVPEGYIDGEANDLFRFLGSFWRNIHKGTEFVKGLQQVRGIKLGQFYLDLLETLKLQDRRGLPVFHRELWKPLVIRLSNRNKSQENVLRMGDDAKLGVQDPGSKYGEHTLEIGSLASLEKYVTYPVDGDIESIVSGISDNVINPKVFLKIVAEFPGEDSEVVYSNGTLIFPKALDPFGEDSQFESYDLPDFFTDEEGNQVIDREVTLWASDVLVDKDFVTDHMAYALGINCPSTEIAKRIINAGWDAINCGLTPELLRTLLAAMLNIPVVQEPEETVKTVINPSNDTGYVITTDFHKYNLGKNAAIRDSVNVGSVLHRGEFLDQSVKIYPMLVDWSEEKLQGTSEYADIFKTDVPVLTLPRTILRTKTANGLSVDWEPTSVLDSGEVDKNGNRKLYFDIGGPEDDVDKFWEETWEYAEAHGIDLDEVFAECEPDSESSSEGWKIVPAEFFLRHMIGGNTMIVTLDKDQIDDISIIRDPMFFNILNDVLPSGMRMFFIEHSSIGDDRDSFDLGGEDQEEFTEQYAALDADDEIEYDELPGIRGHRMPSYEEELEMKFIRDRKRSVE